MLCINQDQYVTTRIKFIQSPCIEGKNCPKVVKVDKEEKGPCDGKLTLQKKISPFVMNYTQNSAYTNSNKTALDFFVNSDAKNCPITNCTMNL